MPQALNPKPSTLSLAGWRRVGHHGYCLWTHHDRGHAQDHGCHDRRRHDSRCPRPPEPCAHPLDRCLVDGSRNARAPLGYDAHRWHHDEDWCVRVDWCCRLQALWRRQDQASDASLHCDGGPIGFPRQRHDDSSHLPRHLQAVQARQHRPPPLPHL